MRDGHKVIVMLSDRYIARDKLPVHALLATGAVHHRLVEAGLRCDATSSSRPGPRAIRTTSPCLIGYGATAVYPYLAYECCTTCSQPADQHRHAAQLGRSYRRGIRKGLFKIMSKMGISTIASYRGAQLFEIVGLHDEVVDRCFRAPSAASRAPTSPTSLDDQRRARAERLGAGASPSTRAGCSSTCTAASTTPSTRTWSRRCRRRCERRLRRATANTPRWSTTGPPRRCATCSSCAGGVTPVPLDEVEPVEAILPRFDSAGMSLGALSPEAHEALAIAMNRIGARSNSGEGGEDAARYGNERRSKIKQVASGRFGVTAEYLVNAEVIQIKIAQGAKPGEGGQLPGHKVNEMIARLRYAKPGVGLISPPPHHDIYSIEDLAQLIFDLKQVNPDALVSVKLVAEPGVGTIAGRRRQGLRRPHHDLRLRRRHRREPAHLGQVRRQPLGARPGRGPPGAAGQRPAAPGPAADRRRAQDRPRRRQGGDARRRELRLRHGADGRAGLQVPAHLPSEQLRDRRRHAEQRAAEQALHRTARDGDQLLPLRRRGGARDHGRRSACASSTS